MEQYPLEGKTALISGASQGLGYAMALVLARLGANIFTVSIGDDTRLKEEVKECGRNYQSMQVSLTTPGICDQVIKEALAAFGSIDLLLNFAGILKKEKTSTITQESLQQVLNINVISTFLLSQAVIKQFLKQGNGGKIINASGVLPTSFEYTSYYTSKGAIEAMTKILAKEYAKQDIQVNAISFGFMTTGTSLQSIDANHYDASILNEIPAKRWGTYKDVEGLLTLLCTRKSNYMTGLCIPIDGGYSIH